MGKGLVSAHSPRVHSPSNGCVSKWDRVFSGWALLSRLLSCHTSAARISFQQLQLLSKNQPECTPVLKVLAKQISPWFFNSTHVLRTEAEWNQILSQSHKWLVFQFLIEPRVPFISLKRWASTVHISLNILSSELPESGPCALPKALKWFSSLTF